MSRLSHLASALPSLDPQYEPNISSSTRRLQTDGNSSYTHDVQLIWHAMLLGGVIGLMGCELTRPNISYDACLAGKAPCREV